LSHPTVYRVWAIRLEASTIGVGAFDWDWETEDNRFTIACDAPLDVLKAVLMTPTEDQDELSYPRPDQREQLAQHVIASLVSFDAHLENERLIAEEEDSDEEEEEDDDLGYIYRRPAEGATIYTYEGVLQDFNVFPYKLMALRMENSTIGVVAFEHNCDTDEIKITCDAPLEVLKEVLLTYSCDIEHPYNEGREECDQAVRDTVATLH
jgi:hypothetical protein